MPRRLVFFWDYRADPLWDAESAGMVRLEALPLSDETRSVLGEWLTRTTESALAELDADAPDRDEQARAAEFESLWKRIREELGAEFLVGTPVAVDTDGERHVRWAPDGPAEPFRYPGEMSDGDV